MPIINPADIEIAPIAQFEGLYYGFPYGFETQVKKLCDSFFLCDTPVAYARFLQRICTPTWLLPYTPDELADPFRRRMIGTLQAINADIVLVPEAQRASTLIAATRNIIRFSHHSKGKVDHTWHYKIAYTPNTYHFDREGFSGWSELYNVKAAEIENVSTIAADTHYEKKIKLILNSRKSKYVQDDKERFEGSDFVFIPLQIPDDAVIQWALTRDYAALMLDAIRVIIRKGLKVVVKRHPLCKSSAVTQMLSVVADEGCVVTSASIHQILPRAIAIVTVNSGVGFEALLYLKPVICLGRSDYSVAGWDVKKIEDLDAALTLALLGKSAEFIKQFLLLAMTKYQVDCGGDIGMKQHVLRALCWNYLSLPRP